MRAPGGSPCKNNVQNIVGKNNGVMYWFVYFRLEKRFSYSDHQFYNIKYIFRDKIRKFRHEHSVAFYRNG